MHFDYLIRNKITKRLISLVLPLVSLGTIFLPQLNVGAVSEAPASGKPVDVCNVGLNCLFGTDNLTQSGEGTNQSIVTIISSVANILIFLGFAIAIVFAVFQGFQMVTSNGDEKKYGQALRALTYILLGMIVLGFATVIVQAIINILSSPIN